jgi:hypothetical protein
LLLLGFSCLLGAKQYFGDPIKCTGDGTEVNTMNAYCWIHGTWTIKEYAADNYAKHTAFSGVGPELPGETKVHHKYYQWVPLAMAISAVCFYLPR